MRPSRSALEPAGLLGVKIETFGGRLGCWVAAADEDVSVAGGCFPDASLDDILCQCGGGGVVKSG